MKIYKTNEIILYRDYAELIIYSKNKEQRFISLIDLEDVEYVEKYSWCIRSRGYVGRAPKGKIIHLHKVLIECPDNMVVDHINRNKLDNRKSNLRVCTQQENLFNSLKKSNNVSGYVGVGFDKKSNKWRARITKDGKNICLGFYNIKEEALIARLKGEKEHFKEFAPQRHLFLKYNI